MTNESELERMHRPRTLHTRAGIQPRVSRADEDAITSDAHRRGQEAAWDELADTLARMRKDLARVTVLLGRVGAGNCRNQVREIEHGLKGLSHIKG